MMWNKVSELEPDINGKTLLCRTVDDVSLCIYDGEDFYELHNNQKYRPLYWMNIPDIED